ncbi:hypothetical protein F5Y14DRAFT_48177 [Nemania sp. NC0429]|nr:hypothetical protein F5Y14DRAFT_48177 [Nemania sp. NC0429]
MAPHYELYGNFTVDDALTKAGAPNYTTEFLAGEPPIHFFMRPPPHAPALLSTFGGKPFRFLQDPPLERTASFWWAAEIQRVCDEFRRNAPGVCKMVQDPQSYLDLYKYFDAHDIYYRGAQNLWNVLKSLHFENNYVHNIVDKEQQAQLQKYAPLFESVAIELLKRPDMQTKLTGWNKEKQSDVLEVLTGYELQIFDGFEKYPEHLKGAIRNIFERHHGCLLKGLPLADSTAAADGLTAKLLPAQKVALTASLRRVLMASATSDPFMGKFNISNPAMKGVVIVDGTSQTAVTKEASKATLTTASSDAQQQEDTQRVPATELPAETSSATTFVQRNGTVTLPPPEAMPTDAAILSVKNGNSTAQRCLSAPNRGGSPLHALDSAIIDAGRVYPGGDHPVTQKLTAPVAMPAPVNHEQHPPSSMRHHDGQHGPNGHLPPPPPPMRQQVFPGPVPVAGPMPPPPPPPGAFTHQIPPFALPQRPVPSPPQHMIQQAQMPHHAHASSNGSNYMVPPTPQYHVNHPVHHPHHGHNHSVYGHPNGGHMPQHHMIPHAPPHFHHGAPPGFTNGPANAGQHMGQPTVRHVSGGKWQPVGLDNIHGPKVVYRRDSKVGSDGAQDQARRLSTTSTVGSDTSMSSLGEQLKDFKCVNNGRRINRFTKFYACPCKKCKHHDRTIFVNRLPLGANQNEGVMKLLKDYFSQHGPIVSVTVPYLSEMAVHIQYKRTKYALAAVVKEPSVRISALGDKPLQVSFRTGSQFFEPHSRPGPDGRRNISPEEAQSMPRQPFGPYTRNPTEHALNLLNRAASQSGFQPMNTQHVPHPGMTAPVYARPPPGLPVPAHAVPMPTPVYHQGPQYGSGSGSPTGSSPDSRVSQQPVAGNGTMDYSTVRVRPELAQHMPVSFPSEWREAPELLELIQGRSASNSPKDTTEKKVATTTTTTSTQRGPEADATNQPQPTNSETKVSTGPVKGNQQQATQPKAGKKNKKNRRNKGSQAATMPPPMPTPRSEPLTVAAPPAEVTLPTTAPTTNPDSAQVPDVSTNEPFPEYRDPMSDPEVDTQDIEIPVSPATEISVPVPEAGPNDDAPLSSDAPPTTLQSSALNPVAQDFVPSPIGEENINGCGNDEGKDEPKEPKTWKSLVEAAPLLEVVKEDTEKQPEVSVTDVQSSSDNASQEGDNTNNKSSNDPVVDTCETEPTPATTEPTVKKPKASTAPKKGPDAGNHIRGKKAIRAAKLDMSKAAKAARAAAGEPATSPTKSWKAGPKATAAKMKKRTSSDKSSSSKEHSRAPSPAPTTTLVPAPVPTPASSSAPSPKSQAAGSPSGGEKVTVTVTATVTVTDETKEKVNAKDTMKDTEKAVKQQAPAEPKPATLPAEPATTAAPAPTPAPTKPVPETKVKITIVKNDTQTTGVKTTATKTKNRVTSPVHAPIPLKGGPGSGGRKNGKNEKNGRK